MINSSLVTEEVELSFPRLVGSSSRRRSIRSRRQAAAVVSTGNGKENDQRKIMLRVGLGRRHRRDFVDQRRRAGARPRAEVRRPTHREHAFRCVASSHRCRRRGRPEFPPGRFRVFRGAADRSCDRARGRDGRAGPIVGCGQSESAERSDLLFVPVHCRATLVKKVSGARQL